MLVAGQSRPQAIDCIERAGTDVMKRSPVEGNEVPGPGALEQAQGIGGGEMSSPKSRFPPRSVTNRKECDVKLSIPIAEVLVNDAVRVLR